MIEVRGVGFKNKGAELMLHAIVQEVATWEPAQGLAVSPSIGPYEKRAQLGLYQRVGFPRLGRFADAPGEIIPGRVRQMFGLASGSEVSAILDASGFALGDQWGPRSTEYLAGRASRWRQQGKKIILLPQAFGPFSSPDIRRAFSQVLENVDLVFARDKESYEHILGLEGRSDHVRIAPDFTHTVRGEIPPYVTGESRMVAVVPNYRMLEKTNERVSTAYFTTLVKAIQDVHQRGLAPFILIHDVGFDLELASRIQALAGIPIEVVEEQNPLYLKGLLARSYAVIGSRYHAIISALSQGVPVLVTGWSHKYRMLLDDYHCPECLIDLENGGEEVSTKLDIILEKPAREGVIEAIDSVNQTYRVKTGEMWLLVRHWLGVEVRATPSVKW